jgi:hypothetical protein
MGIGVLAREFAASFSAFDRLYSLRLALAMQMDELAEFGDFPPGKSDLL